MSKFIKSNFYISFFISLLSLFAFSLSAKTTVTWWAEANADRDPVFVEKLVGAFNSSQSEIELVMDFKEALNDTLRTAMIAGEGLI